MIRISNKIKTLLAMLSFVQVTSGCDATVQDIIIDTDPGVEIGNNDYYTSVSYTHLTLPTIA